MMNRRSFLVNSAGALTASAATRVKSPNETVRLACVGLHTRGQVHLKSFGPLANVEIVALCDIDDAVAAKSAQVVEGMSGRRPAVYRDFRKLLEDKTIDAVSLATPNHWHTLQTIWACQAGKDVYVEKPCTHNLFEAKQIVAAARKYDRLVQHGSQSRSSPALQEAVRKLKEGLIGDVYMSRALVYKWRPSIGRTPVEPVPAGVDYDLFTGPAPKKPFTRNRFHYNWHWFWDFGNGDLGNQGIHELDVARWALGVKYPTRVTATGGHFLFDDDQETPNTMNVAYEFQDAGRKQMLVFDLRHWMTHHEAGLHEFDLKSKSTTVGNVFYGRNGYLAMDGYFKYESWLGKEQEPGPSRKEAGNHFANFIDAVRSRRRGDLNAEIEEGAVSTVLVHLANISYRLGRSVNFDAGSYTCPGDEEATRMFTRDYRAPFVVPGKV